MTKAHSNVYITSLQNFLGHALTTPPTLQHDMALSADSCGTEVAITSHHMRHTAITKKKKRQKKKIKKERNDKIGGTFKENAI